MTQKEKEQTCVKICAYTCKKIYAETYPEETKKSLINKVNDLIEDIESRLHIIYNGDRCSIVEVTHFILQNISNLQYAIERERMDIYNCDTYDIADIY